MSAVLAHDGLPAGMGRNRLRQIVREVCTEVLGLPTLAVNYLDYIISCTQECDYEPGRICGAWPSSKQIKKRLRKSTRQINEIEKLLEDADLICRTNGRSSRCGERRGVILWLYGINLAPLISRAAELADKLNAFRRAETLKEEAVKLERVRIREMRRAIREADIVSLKSEADSISNFGRIGHIDDIERLREMANALEAIVDCVAAQSGERKTAHRSAENRSPNTTPQSTQESCRGPAAPPTGEPEAVTLRQALMVATPHYRERFAVHGQPTWRALEETSRQVALDHGITAASWQMMCRRWSPEAAALSVLLIDRNAHLPNGHRYRAKHFGKCFAGLSRDPSSVVRLIKAAMGFAEGDCVDRRFEPEPRRDDGRQRIGNLLPAFLAKLETMEAADG